ncbi:hypothetical protein BDV11DRAFT_169357 [Aspergillus similis]
MQTPSDNANDVRHGFQKFTVHPQSSSLTTMATINSRPPPSYTAAIAAQDLNPCNDDKYDDNDHHSHVNMTEHYTNTTTTPSFPVLSTTSTARTVVISLDSSIHIRGDGNTVAIVSGQGQSQAQAQTQTQPQASNPKSKVASTTASIIAALQQSGILVSRPDAGSSSASTTVQININAGIKVRGFQNVVCFGALMVPTTSVRGSKANVNMKNYNARKRRAQSEPATNRSEWKKYRKC